jgi:hypothetical protein
MLKSMEVKNEGSNAVWEGLDKFKKAKKK